MKKIISVLLMICLVFSTFSVSISANGEKPDPADKISKDLLETMEQANPEELIPVTIWLEEIELESGDIPREDPVIRQIVADKGLAKDQQLKLIQERLAKRRQEYAEKQYKQNCDTLYSCVNDSEMEQRELFVSKYAPMIITELTRDEIMALAENETTDNFTQTERMSEFETRNDSLETVNSADTAYSINDYFAMEGIALNRDDEGYTGEGIKIGIVDPGVPSSLASNLQGASITTHNTSSNPVVQDHATKMAEILVSQNPNALGAVPDAELYIVATLDLSDAYSSIEWLVGQDVNIILMTYELTFQIIDNQMPQNHHNTTLWNFVYWVEHLAIKHSIHYVAAAGNIPSNDDFPLGNPTDEIYYVAGSAMAYNAITVGNIKTNGNSNSSRYLQDNGYANKPDISALGSNVYIDSPTNTISGTSVSAATVAGALAQLIQCFPEILTQQDTAKALLTAGISHESIRYQTEENHSPSVSYEFKGAGLFDSVFACWSDFNYSSFPIGTTQGTTKHLDDIIIVYGEEGLPCRIALTWLKYNRAAANGSTCGHSLEINEPLADLDLIIKDSSGNTLAYSTLTTGNVEILEFTPTIRGTYKIYVKYNSARTSQRKTYFSVAWFSPLATFYSWTQH